eukprot:CAMPEP_0115343356 /NCGR_PEP_ID=MMETSP0270-20121206/92696_1 /TAXON_ID=71861 /ORGANISM="Scrippsiella trochoidea, Strain CCMP3099" /LENGTH=56 /DNA_ID=CAMNT_0002764991 /DNA_START=55 /DNA_END=221 /DNA_ORIENTATION=-
MTGQGHAILHPSSDRLVRDCEALFVRTAYENCKKEFTVVVHSATLGVIDGFMVSMT